MITLCPDDKVNTHGSVKLKVLGVGGGGGNAVNSMLHQADMEAVEFLVANTDAQALHHSTASYKIQLGAKSTKGLGAGSNPDVGRQAAQEDLETIIELIAGADILFLTAGLGGGTGSGALPIIAQAAKDSGMLTIAVVTTPFLFEGKKRQRHASDAIVTLQNTVDTLIVVPNQRLLEIVDQNISMLDAFALSNDILKQAIKGIVDIITKSGHINVDFADVKNIMKGMGRALMGTGRASGENRAKRAAQAAITSPLLENVSINGAQGVLLNICGNKDLGLYEINEAASLIYELVSEDANIILGSVIDESMGNEIMVTVIATGVDAHVQHCATPTSPAAMAPVQTVACAIKTEDMTTHQFNKPHTDQELGQESYNESSDLEIPTYLRKECSTAPINPETKTDMNVSMDNKTEQKKERYDLRLSA